MKIKLAILEKDVSYLNRFVNVFSTKYAEKIEVYSFTDCEVALNAGIGLLALATGGTGFIFFKKSKTRK